MAVGAVSSSNVTNLTTSAISFYPVKIPVSHWQLRHYISAPEADHLYYASGHDIYCLNTNTKKRKHVATLPFEARCSASGYGWVCVGGEESGHFAAIRVNSNVPRPVEVDSTMSTDAWDQAGARDVKVERIGEEIVNSISIHRIADENAHLDDIVAVLTNNDKTVRIYSLPQGLEATVLDLPFAMNHATISPDGKLLAAVGDYNHAFFFSREITATPPQIPKPHNRLSSTDVRWVSTNVLKLHVIPRLDASSGYFTTAWSPNGRLVALGSEGGYINIINIDILQDKEADQQNAIVAVVPSSRANVPNSHAGAVRSMMFAPDPWDLLIWAEDQGRICVADLRTALQTKQVISLEPKDPTLETVSYENVSVGEPLVAAAPSRTTNGADPDYLQRYRQSPETGTTARLAAELSEVRRLHRRQRVWEGQDGQPEITHGPQGLSATEQRVLDSLRTGRQREEARSRGTRPTNINYTSQDLFDRNAVEPTALGVTDPAWVVSHDAPWVAQTGSPNSYNDRLLPQLETFRQFAEASTRSGNLNRIDGSRLPRRRWPGSSGTSNPTSAGAGDRPSSSHNRIAARNLSETVSDLISLARGPLFEGAGMVPAEPPVPAEQSESIRRHRAALEQRVRDRALQARERWPNDRVDISWNLIMPVSRDATLSPASYEAILLRPQPSRSTAQEIGVRTAGLAMSPDGRTLWAACEEGIFEMQLNIKQRMFMPATDPL